MLSYIFRISQLFRAQNGYRPNILYINNEHFSHLCSEIDDIQDLDQLTRLLGMDIVLSLEATHPTVSWSSVSWSNQAVSA